MLLRLNLAPPRSVMIRLFFGNGPVVMGLLRRLYGAFTELRRTTGPQRYLDGAIHMQERRHREAPHSALCPRGARAMPPRIRMRQALGGSPIMRLKTAVKCACELKPQLSATLSTLKSDERSSICACSSRRRCR